MPETKHDFGAVLDDLLRSDASHRQDIGPTPKLQVDLLDQIERLQSENASVFAEDGLTTYRAAALEPEAQAVLDALIPDLPTRPDDIRDELDLGRARTGADFDRIRRAFAFANHPDRLSPHLRAQAEERMRIANTLIDEAKARKR